MLKYLGDYQGAKTLLEKAVNSAEKYYGTDHPTTATRYSNLAVVLQDLREYNEALIFSRKALSIFRNALPKGHPHITTVSSIHQSIRKEMGLD